MRARSISRLRVLSVAVLLMLAPFSLSLSNGLTSNEACGQRSTSCVPELDSFCELGDEVFEDYVTE